MLSTQLIAKTTQRTILMKSLCTTNLVKFVYHKSVMDVARPRNQCSHRSHEKGAFRKLKGKSNSLMQGDKVEDRTLQCRRVGFGQSCCCLRCLFGNAQILHWTNMDEEMCRCANSAFYTMIWCLIVKNRLSFCSIPVVICPGAFTWRFGCWCDSASLSGALVEWPQQLWNIFETYYDSWSCFVGFH